MTSRSYSPVCFRNQRFCLETTCKKEENNSSKKNAGRRTWKTDEGVVEHLATIHVPIFQLWAAGQSPIRVTRSVTCSGGVPASKHSRRTTIIPVTPSASQSLTPRQALQYQKQKKSTHGLNYPLMVWETIEKKLGSFHWSILGAPYS